MRATTPGPPRRSPVLAVWFPVVTVVLLATACAGGSTTAPSTSTTSAPATTTSGPTTGTGAAPVVLTDADNGHSVSVAVGTRVTLVLASTYWTVGPASGGPVLRSSGPPVVEPRLGHCVPGQGCGTVTAAYTAVASGTGTLSASRTVCGEALACSAAQRSYRVVVTVG